MITRKNKQDLTKNNLLVRKPYVDYHVIPGRLLGRIQPEIIWVTNICLHFWNLELTKDNNQLDTRACFLWQTFDPCMINNLFTWEASILQID